MATEPRTQHPYHMYDAIYAQPAAFADVALRAQEHIEHIASELAGSRHIFLVGIGTSHHAAQVGQYLFRYCNVQDYTQAYPAFDFALYGPPLTPNDSVIVISHRGTKRYSRDSIQRAKEAGGYTLLITGEGEPASQQYADDTLHTTEQDKSSAHTVSYTGSIAVLASLAAALGTQEQLSPTFLQEEFPETLRQCLQTEPLVKELASQHLNHRRIWFVGGGPSGITAQEAALKVKETSYLQAEGMATETMLHGPFQCAEPEDLFILIAPTGPAQARTLQLAPMIREIGASYFILNDGSSEAFQADAAGSIVVPPAPEPLTALTCAIPLQLFAYHLALAHGTDPDGFRKDDPRFAAATGLVLL